MKYVILEEISLDSFLSKYYLSSKMIYKLKESKNLYLNDIEVKINVNPILKVNDVVEIKENHEIVKTKYAKKIEIVYQDEYILIANKPSKMLVHQDGNTTDTLLNYIAYQENVDTLKPIHRIDFDTCGLVLFSKNLFAHSFLNYQMEHNMIKKQYSLTCFGKIDVSDTFNKIETYIGKNRHKSNEYMVLKDKAPNAITYYKCIRNRKLDGVVVSDCVAQIVTGKTHQIRVHMKHINHPIVNDKIYSNKAVKGDMMLTNMMLEFISPKDFTVLHIELEA